MGQISVVDQIQEVRVEMPPNAVRTHDRTFQRRFTVARPDDGIGYDPNVRPRGRRGLVKYIPPEALSTLRLYAARARRR